MFELPVLYFLHGRKNFVLLTKLNDISGWNVSISCKQRNFSIIYSSEKTFANSTFKSGLLRVSVFSILRLWTHWLFNNRKNENLFWKFLWKKWPQKNSFLEISFSQNCIVDLYKRSLIRFRPKIFLKVNTFCQKIPFSKENSIGAKCQHSLKLASCVFHKQSQRLFLMVCHLPAS